MAERLCVPCGDCLEVTEWLAADVLATDPPYGRAWRQGDTRTPGEIRRGLKPDGHRGIAGDETTRVRDEAMALWGSLRPSIVFGDLMLPAPVGTQLVAIYRKPSNAGMRGGVAGIRRDCEAIYFRGFPTGLAGGGRSSVFATRVRSQGGPSSPIGRFGHPHVKPGDVMEELITLAPLGAIADPFAGSGSTLVAAKALGRRAIGVEIDEHYCEIAARRLAQDVLDFSGGAS